MSELASRLAGAVGTVSGDADLIRLSVAAGDRAVFERELEALLTQTKW